MEFTSIKNLERKMKIRVEKLEKCPVCRSDYIKKSMKGYDYETKTGEYDILHCNNCQVYFTNPQPVEEDIPLLYEDRSSADFPEMNSISSYLRKFNAKLFLRNTLKFINKKELKVLDYGCGDGLLATVLSENKIFNKVHAVDFHSQSPELLREKSNIKYFSYQNFAAVDENKYDIIFCRHVVEHTRDPEVFIKNLKNMLNENGLLYMESPNYNSIWRIIFGKYYFGLYLPRHLIHFNESSAKFIYNEHFKTVYIFKSHTPIVGASLGYILNIKIRNLGIFGLLSYPVQILLDKIFFKSTTIKVVCKDKK